MMDNSAMSCSSGLSPSCNSLLSPSFQSHSPSPLSSPCTSSQPYGLSQPHGLSQPLAPTPATPLSLVAPSSLPQSVPSRVAAIAPALPPAPSFSSLSGNHVTKLSLFTHCILPPPAPRVLLLHGPPGTGKTTLSRMLASELAIPFIEASHSQLLSKYIGSAERYVVSLFSALGSAPEGGVLFFDEIDSLTSRHSSSVMKQLQICINHFIADPNQIIPTRTIVVMATNHIDILPPSLLRRFTLKLFLGYLPYADRLHLLSSHFASKSIAVLDDVLSFVATQTRGWSASDMLLLCQDAAELRVTDIVSAHNVGSRGADGTENWIVTDALRAAMESLRPVSQEDFGKAISALLCSGQESGSPGSSANTTV